MTPGSENPTLGLLLRAALGEFPPADWTTEIWPAPPGPVHGVLGFVSHHVVAVDVDRTWLDSNLEPGDPLSPMRSRFLTNLADRLGCPAGFPDCVLAATGQVDKSGLRLMEVEPDPIHPRVASSLHRRDETRVFATTEGNSLLCLGRGLAGRWEASFEVDPGARNRGIGRALAIAARSLVEAGEPLFMQVTPGNAASLRAVLAAGFKPIGSEILFEKASS